MVVAGAAGAGVCGVVMGVGGLGGGAADLMCDDRANVLAGQGGGVGGRRLIDKKHSSEKLKPIQTNQQQQKQ